MEFGDFETSSKVSEKSQLSWYPGLKITAGHRTMSGQDDYLSGQNLGLAVNLTGQVRGFQIIHKKKIFPLFPENINSEIIKYLSGL